MQTKFGKKNPEARRVTRKPNYRQEDNIKVNLEEAGWDSSGSEQGSVVDSSEHYNELLGFIECWKFLDYMSSYQFFNMYHALLSFRTV
jgi:hypothetical protein